MKHRSGKARWNEAGEKQCPRCLEFKVTGDYYRNSRRSDNLSGYCKLCENARVKGWLQGHRAPPPAEPALQDCQRWFGFFGPEWRAHRSRLFSYGLTLDDYIQLWEDQGGVCAICGQDETRHSRNKSRWSLSIDHCHATNQVRGLLCCSCNVAVARIESNPQCLKGLVRYLTLVLRLREAGKD